MKKNNSSLPSLPSFPSFVRTSLPLAVLQLGLLLCPAKPPPVQVNISPSTVSNTYNGTVTLQVTGVAGGASVVVQKFLDLNANAVMDAGDSLVQQFNLTDGQPGMVIGGVNNSNVPGDTDSISGQITAKFNFLNGDFAQNFVGQYLYVVSSPSGSFTPVTNLFTVTNASYAQSFNGNVVSNGTGTTVPNAVVVFMHPNGSAMGGVVANSSGGYTLPAPPGTYQLIAFKSNWLFSENSGPVLVLGSGQTVTANLSITNATASISGQLLDANNSSIGLPGVFLGAKGNNGLSGMSFTDSNGNFTVGVAPGQSGLRVQATSLMVHGYVTSENRTTVSAGQTGISLTASQATALFYGSVRDSLGNPMPGLVVDAYDNNNLYEPEAFTDANGNYVVGVLGGLANDSWQVQLSSDYLPTNYLFSQPGFDQNGGTNISAGTAAAVNFTALLVTNHITGTAKDSNGNPIPGVGVMCNATISNVNYFEYVDTDANGNYSMNVANGSWSISLESYGGSDSLDAIFGSGDYQPPNNQTVTIANNNSTNNFTVDLCSGITITTTSLPAGQVNAYYTQFLQASSCSSSFSWALLSSSLPPGLNGTPSGEIFGAPTTSGTYYFTVQVTDGNGLIAEQVLSLTINGGPLQVTTSSLSGGATNVAYNSQQLTARGGQPPYIWSLASGALPAGLSLSNNGVISGTPTTAGTSNFVVRVTDSALATATQALSLTIYVYSSAVTFTVTPPVISNTYNGIITLQVKGLNSGETVTVNRYLDLNSNGVIDGGDCLVQQFELTDGQPGMVIGGITNYLVPGELDTTPGQITANLYFPNPNFMQNLVGQYIFRLGSPIHRFAPTTNLFIVTNTPCPQQFTGTVVNTANNEPVPNALVVFMNNNGDLGGAVANNSGGYTLQVPADQYFLWAVKGGHLTDFSTVSFLALDSGATYVANLDLTSATTNISGQLVDASNPSLPLPGVMVNARAIKGLSGFTFTDTNGCYTVGVGTGGGQWSLSAQDTSLFGLGYVGLQNGVSASAGQTNVTLAAPRATAMFYGRVTDTLGNPMVGLDMNLWDNNNVFNCESGTGPGGYYEAAVLGGLNNDGWQIQINNGNLPVNYMFSQPGFDNNGGTNLASDTALPVNFTGLLATNTISGWLKDGSGNPFSNIGIWASMTVNGASFYPYADTDSQGHYSMTVGAGAWNVGVNTSGSGDSLPGDYFCPSQLVVISNQNATVNFTATLPTSTISGWLTNASGNPIAGVQISANANINGLNYSRQAITDGSGHYSLSAGNGTWTVGVNTYGSVNALPGNYLSPPNQTVVIYNDNGTANFTAIPTTHTISGRLTDNNGNPIPNIGLDAYAQINGVGFNSIAGETDADGWYSLNVINGDWNVFLLGPGGYDSLPASFLCPSGQQVSISGNNGTANFIAIPATAVISGSVKDGNGNPIAGVGVEAAATINDIWYNVSADTAADGSYSLNVAGGIWDITVNCYNGGDSLQNLGNYACPNDQYTTIFTNNATNNFIVQLCGGVSIAPSLPPGEVGVYYDQSLMASSCNPSFTWSLLGGSPPPGLTGDPSTGEITGIPEGAGTFNFTVQVTDGNSATANSQITIGISNAVQITTENLPNGTNGSSYSQQLHAAGGQAPYTWGLGDGGLPPGLSLSGSGLISGQPTQVGTFSFSAEVQDNLGGYAGQFFPINLTILAAASVPPPAIGPAARLPGGQFQFLLTGAANQNYTILMSTNLRSSDWTTLFVTNNATTNSYNVIDGNPAGSERFYRVKVGP